MKSHVYEAGELVIGHGLNAVLYSYINDCMILLNKQEKPFLFDMLNFKLVIFISLYSLIKSTKTNFLTVQILNVSLFKK